MRNIQISDAVWIAIAGRGKFGETEDQVLRRVFNLAPEDGPSRPLTPPKRTAGSAPAIAGTRQRRSFATRRMSSYVQQGRLIVEFQGGERREFHLPPKEDKMALRRVRDEAVEFATRSGASYGQQMAVKKALTEAGYHLLR